MFSNPSGIAHALQSFQINDRMMCYTSFIPRLYNWCLKLGFTPGKIMPSRAFCSDESQGVPIILLAKHFGVFPFNHGRVGGIVSVDRHGPHADHGQDLMLLQSSHVGYDPATGEFGNYRRLHTENSDNSRSCGKIGHILEECRSAYRYARENIRLARFEGQLAVLVDNMLLDIERTQGLFLNLDRLVHHDANGKFVTLNTLSTAYILPASSMLIDRLGSDSWPLEDAVELGNRLAPEDFYFKQIFASANPLQDQLERNLLLPMPWIVSSKHPLLTAACVNTQAEFDRTYRSLTHNPAMRGKNMLFLSGINIDISPTEHTRFPLTQFVPWAAYLHLADGTRKIMEQSELLETLSSMPTANPDQIRFDESIEIMNQAPKAPVQL
ncbi:MAG: hypothetical protein R6W97_13595 [Thiobacillus sp.]